MTQSTETIPNPQPRVRAPLRRSRTDRMVGGVAGGVARWLEIDPVIVRVILVVLAIFGGSGLVLYAVGWLFIPEEGEPVSQAQRMLEDSGRPGSTGRTAFVVVGVLLVVLIFGGLASAGPWGGVWGGGGWLLLLAAGGLVLWLVNRPPTGTAAWTAGPTAAPADLAGPVDPASAAAEVAVVSVADTRVDAVPTGFAYGGFGGYPGYDAPIPAPAPPRVPKERSYLGLATVSIAIIVMGVIASLTTAGIISIPAVVALSIGLAVLGVGLLVGTIVGRARWLVSLAIPLLLVTALVAVIPADFRAQLGHGVGDVTWAPASVVEAQESHQLTMGAGLLDLTDMVLPADPAVSIPVSASVGVGDLQVIVPDGVRVLVTAKAGTGELDVEGFPRVSGSNVQLIEELAGAVDPSAPTINLSVRVTLGSVEVSRA